MVRHPGCEWDMTNFSNSLAIVFAFLFVFVGLKQSRISV